ncbi:hypothetical protein GCM10027067_37010 [Pseudactinotalea suaedae]
MGPRSGTAPRPPMSAVHVLNEPVKSLLALIDTYRGSATPQQLQDAARTPSTPGSPWPATLCR